MTTTYEIQAAHEDATSPTRKPGWFAAAARGVLDRLRESIDYDEADPQHMRSYLALGFCVDCDATRVLARNGTCQHCTSASTLHRHPNVSEGRDARKKEP